MAVQVRDALGLTYDVSFELSLYDRLRTGWFVCHVTSTHAKIDEALDASLRVLRSLPSAAGDPSGAAARQANRPDKARVRDEGTVLPGFWPEFD